MVATVVTAGAFVVATVVGAAAVFCEAEVAERVVVTTAPPASPAIVVTPPAAVVLVPAVVDVVDPGNVVAVSARSPSAAFLPLLLVVALERSILAAAVVSVFEPEFRAGSGAAPATSRTKPANKPIADTERCECCRFISNLWREVSPAPWWSTHPRTYLSDLLHLHDRTGGTLAQVSQQVLNSQHSAGNDSTCCRYAVSCLTMYLLVGGMARRDEPPARAGRTALQPVNGHCRRKDRACCGSVRSSPVNPDRLRSHWSFQQPSHRGNGR